MASGWHAPRAQELTRRAQPPPPPSLARHRFFGHPAPPAADVDRGTSRPRPWGSVSLIWEQAPAAGASRPCRSDAGCPPGSRTQGRSLHRPQSEAGGEATHGDCPGESPSSHTGRETGTDQVSAASSGRPSAALRALSGVGAAVRTAPGALSWEAALGAASGHVVPQLPRESSPPPPCGLAQLLRGRPLTPPTSFVNTIIWLGRVFVWGSVSKQVVGMLD